MCNHQEAKVSLGPNVHSRYFPIFTFIYYFQQNYRFPVNHFLTLLYVPCFELQLVGAIFVQANILEIPLNHMYLPQSSYHSFQNTDENRIRPLEYRLLSSINCSIIDYKIIPANRTGKRLTKHEPSTNQVIIFFPQKSIY